MGSTILSYQNTYDSLTKASATVTLATSLSFADNQQLYIRLIKASISSNIPNIYTVSSQNLNNGLLAVSRDADEATPTWTNIQLPNGVYSVQYINAAINSAISDWWADASDHGIYLSYNYATQLVYIELDSTKLASGSQLGIDFSLSDISTLLGFTDETTQQIITDGLSTATSYAKLDFIGNTISVQLNGFGPLSIKNGIPSNELCTIPLATSTVTNEYLYPSNGIITPLIPLQNRILNLSTYTIQFKGSRQDSDDKYYDIYITEGSINVEFELRWSR